jgi:peroxiredoxin
MQTSEHADEEDTVAIEDDEPFVAPPSQPLRTLAAIALIGAGFALYRYVLVSFWAVPWMGIHDRIPWPAFALLAAALILSIAGLRAALGLYSPHRKLGLGLLAFFFCIVVGVEGGRFVSYAMRVTMNPPFTLNLGVGNPFPSFALDDQNGSLHRGPTPTDAPATLIVVYRGDFDPFARYELAELSAHADDFSRAGVNVIAISADPTDRSKMLAGFLHTNIPLLSDDHESLLTPLGLVQHHRNGEPDNAIPAFVLLDRNGIVRWTFTSPYSREMPRLETLLDAVKTVTAGDSAAPPAPPASP